MNNDQDGFDSGRVDLQHTLPSDYLCELPRAVESVMQGRPRVLRSYGVAILEWHLTAAPAPALSSSRGSDQRLLLLACATDGRIFLFEPFAGSASIENEGISSCRPIVRPICSLGAFDSGISSNGSDCDKPVAAMTNVCTQKTYMRHMCGGMENQLSHIRMR